MFPHYRIVDVADALGLSTATVSKVIHGKTEKISDETVKRVQQELERSGYIPNMAGILLARNNSRIIGVVVELVSGRKLETGLAMEDSVKADGSMLSQVLYQQYLMEKLGNYIEPGKSGLSYQIEYIIGKKNSDEANLKDVAKKLLMVREGLNVAYLVSDALMMGQIHAMAAAIAAAFLIPPAVVVIEGALILCWAFAESILDVRELFAGGKVSLTKNASNWQLSLQGLPALVDKLDTDRQNDVNGLSYEDYLQIFLLTTSKAQKVKGGMDMIESSFREMEDWNEFCLDHCITALEASVDVKANKRKVFTVTREYHYI